jgi:hypothetical protein
MAIIPCSARLLKPLAIHPYFDKIQFWVRNALDRDTLDQLANLCGRGGVHDKNGPARFNSNYRQRIHLRQPSDQALLWLAARDDALINQAEVAIDFVFEYRAYRDEVWEFLHRHLVRRWHGKKQEVRFYRPKAKMPLIADDGTVGTRYDAGRWAPNVIACYREEHSRVTGEVNCLHLEWRLNRLKAMRSAGIELGLDLIGFDHRQFWKKRMLLFTADQERLGRLIRNRANGRRSRKSKVEPYGEWWMNSRTGGVYLRSRDTIQELIDEFGKSCRIHRASVPIPNEVLLPA